MFLLQAFYSVHCVLREITLSQASAQFTSFCWWLSNKTFTNFHFLSCKSKSPSNAFVYMDTLTSRLHEQLHSGHWRVPVRCLPIRPSLSLAQLNSVPQVHRPPGVFWANTWTQHFLHKQCCSLSTQVYTDVLFWADAAFPRLKRGSKWHTWPEYMFLWTSGGQHGAVCTFGQWARRRCTNSGKAWPGQHQPL